MVALGSASFRFASRVVRRVEPCLQPDTFRRSAGPANWWDTFLRNDGKRLPSPPGEMAGPLAGQRPPSDCRFHRQLDPDPVRAKLPPPVHEWGRWRRVL